MLTHTPGPQVGLYKAHSGIKWWSSEKLEPRIPPCVSLSIVVWGCQMKREKCDCAGVSPNVRPSKLWVIKASEMVAVRSQWWMCADFPQCTEVSRVKGNGNRKVCFPICSSRRTGHLENCLSIPTARQQTTKKKYGQI